MSIVTYSFWIRPQLLARQHLGAVDRTENRVRLHLVSFFDKNTVGDSSVHLHNML